jgi:hypothetical protein
MDPRETEGRRLSPDQGTLNERLDEVDGSAREVDGSAREDDDEGTDGP